MKALENNYKLDKFFLSQKTISASQEQRSQSIEAEELDDHALKCKKAFQ